MFLSELAACCAAALHTLTPAAGLLAAPHWQGGVEAGEQRLPLQVVTHVAVKASGAPREQVQHRHLSKVRPFWQGTAQPEDYTHRGKSKVIYVHYESN